MQNTRQWAYQLLRQSLAAAPVHLLRTTPPDITKPAAERLDWTIWRFMMEVAYWHDGAEFWGNSEPRRLTPEHWRATTADPGPKALEAKARMHLRVAQGGLGITSLAGIAETAYAGGILLCAADIKRRGFLGPNSWSPWTGRRHCRTSPTSIQKHSLERVEALANVTCETVFSKSVPGAQAALAAALRDPSYEDVLKRVDDPQAKANFLSMAVPEARAYLLANPAHKRHQIHDLEFSLLLQARMGLPQIPGIGGPDQPKHLLCTMQSDTGDRRVGVGADHAMACKKHTKGFSSRHDTVRDCVLEAVNRATRDGTGFEMKREPCLVEDVHWEREEGHRAGGRTGRRQIF